MRPLLETDRTEWLAYAQHHDLRWIEDASNTQLDFDRNYLRHQIMPLLRERWPSLFLWLPRSGVTAIKLT